MRGWSQDEAVQQLVTPFATFAVSLVAHKLSLHNVQTTEVYACERDTLLDATVHIHL